METLNIIKNFLLVTWARIKSDTPRYWRRLSNIFILLTALAGYISENQSIIPEKYKFVLQIAAGITFGAGVISRLTTTNEVIAQKSEDILLKENADKKLDNI